NSDTRPDVVCALESGIAALLDTPTGTLAAPVVSGPQAKILAVADFNEDGIPDVASSLSDRLAQYSRPLNISLGQGDGRFVVTTTMVTGDKPSSIAVGDVDRDGHQDVAVSNYDDGTTVVLLGRGDGTLVTRSTLPTGRVEQVALADLDLDGRL